MTTLNQHARNLLREPARLAAAPASSLLRYVFRLMRMLSEGGETLFVAAVPKSASSFLLQALAAVTGYPIRRLTYGSERQEQDLYFPRLVDAYGRSTVTRHHTRATGPNLELMKTFRIRPVIVVRNFLDVVPSILDHLYKEGFEKFPFPVLQREVSGARRDGSDRLRHRDGNAVVLQLLRLLVRRLRQGRGRGSVAHLRRDGL